MKLDIVQTSGPKHLLLLERSLELKGNPVVRALSTTGERLIVSNLCPGGTYY